jgi:hypothetical protein
MPMSRLTLQQIRDNARSITDTEADDVSDALLNLYIQDGYNRIIDLERRWPFLEVSFSFTTVADQRAYSIDDFTDDDIREIVSLVDDTNVRLEWISYDLAEETFIRSADGPARPMYVAFWADQFHLFPRPMGEYTILVRAYREPEDWISAGTVLDGPDSFDMPLVYYAVSHIYRSQEAPTMAAEYERMFNDAVAFARRDIMKPDSYSPMVLSSGSWKHRWRNWHTTDYGY